MLGRQFLSSIPIQWYLKLGCRFLNTPKDFFKKEGNNFWLQAI
jgi:hypothetical protein